MSKIVTLAISAVLGSAATGCVVHESPYGYRTTVATDAGPGYPVYYADGVYWAYDNAWYWWANDRWMFASYTPHAPLFVHHAPHHTHPTIARYNGGHSYGSRGYAHSTRSAGVHSQSSHGSSSHGRSHVRSHGGSHGTRSHGSGHHGGRRH